MADQLKLDPVVRAHEISERHRDNRLTIIAANPSLGQSLNRGPPVPWEWQALRTDYRLDGCTYLLRF